MSLASPHRPSDSLRVLIVEDDRIVASDLRATVERMGHVVSGPANTGEAALVLAGKKAPDLALVDIRLAGERDGVDLALALRRDLDIPVIFLTGYSSDAVYARAREARPAGYLRKPFTDGELAACLSAALEQEETRRRHRQQAESLRHVVADLEEAVILSELDGRITLLNAAAEKLTGWPASEAVGRSLSEIAPLTFGSDERQINGAFRPARLQVRNGESREILERSSPLGAEAGPAYGVVTVLRKPAELPAPESEQEEGSESSDFSGGEPPARVLAIARATELANRPAFRELLGPRAEESALPEGENEEQLPLFFEEIGEAGLVDSTNDDGDLVSPLDEIGDPLLNLDPRGQITYANAEALVYFGGATPLIGRNFWASFAEDAKEHYFAEFQRAMMEGRRHHFEFHDTLRDRWLDVSLYRSGSLDTGNLLALFRDITARKQIESESVRLQRLEGLGLLARGFAHDFNNLLTVLIGSLELARERPPDDPEFGEDMDNASRAAGDARDLVQQLLTFSQGGRPIRESTKLTELLRNLLAERRDTHPRIRYQFQSGESDLQARVDRRQVTRLLENLITNSEQAMPEGGALIARCHRISGAEASRLRNVPTDADEDHVVIEIIDTGAGMSEEQLEHAFEPYYTTRGGVNASGIGLTVCESIAKGHDGFILLQSKEGRGTIATLCLPVRERTASHATLPANVFMPRQADRALSPGPGKDSPAEEAHVPRSFFQNEPESAEVEADTKVSETFTPEVGAGIEKSVSGRILILEDDSLIRRLIAVTLRRDGHEVVETADGHDTVRLYEESKKSGRPFDLVLSDLTIEHGLGGVETMRALKQFDPAVMAIVSSGYSDAPAMARPAEFGFSAVLPKPYPPRELRTLVTQLLEQKRQRDDRATFPA